MGPSSERPAGQPGLGGWGTSENGAPGPQEAEAHCEKAAPLAVSVSSRPSTVWSPHSEDGVASHLSGPFCRVP